MDLGWPHLLTPSALVPCLCRPPSSPAGVITPSFSIPKTIRETHARNYDASGVHNHSQPVLLGITANHGPSSFGTTTWPHVATKTWPAWSLVGFSKAALPPCHPPSVATSCRGKRNGRSGLKWEATVSSSACTKGCRAAGCGLLRQLPKPFPRETFKDRRDAAFLYKYIWYVCVCKKLE